MNVLEVLNMMLRDIAVVSIGCLALMCLYKMLHYAGIVIMSVFNYYHGLITKKKDEPQYYMMHDPDFAIRLESIAKEKGLDLENGDVLAFWVCKEGANILNSDQLKECLRS